MAVTQQVLPAQQHLQARVGQRGAQLAQAFPRVFVQKAHAGIEGGAAPALPATRKPTSSSLSQIGSMSAVRMRVAISDWWASRRMDR